MSRMSSELLSLADEGATFLADFERKNETFHCELSSTYEKLLDAIRAFQNMRADIFTKSEEKIQQYKQRQMLILKNEEENFLHKSQELENNISQIKTQLKGVEGSYFKLNKKLMVEMDQYKNLKNDVAHLKEEKEKARERFSKTHSLYTTVIQWYQDYLNIQIALNKENSNIVTIYFGKDHNNVSNTPFVKLERVDENKFKLLEVHSELETGKENISEPFNMYELVSFMYGIHRGLTDQKMLE